jgi:hypothetical protein
VTCGKSTIVARRLESPTDGPPAGFVKLRKKHKFVTYPHRAQSVVAPIREIQ